MEFNLLLSEEDVKKVLEGLGQLPTTSGSWPVYQKIKLQVGLQIKEKEMDSTKDKVVE